VNQSLLDYARSAIEAAPQVKAHLSMQTRYTLAIPSVKTYDYFLEVVERAVKSVYNGLIGGDFVDILGSLIKGQIKQAYEAAWTDEGNDPPLPAFLETAMNNSIDDQSNFDWIYQYYQDIIDARVDKTSIEPLLYRAQLWANRYTEAQNDAARLIQSEMGGNMIWRMGGTEKHCSTCAALDGIVAYATEWETAQLKPQGAPNDLLECGGWNCGCSLEPTEQRRSPKALDTLMNIAVSKGM
jgi:hypothetical protein